MNNEAILFRFHEQFKLVSKLKMKNEMKFPK